MSLPAGEMVRLFDSEPEARDFLLRRRRLEDTTLPPRVRESVRRIFGADLSASDVVERILADVRREGDRALRRYTLAIDGADLGDLRVSSEEFATARAQVAPDVIEALQLARARIERFHQRQLRTSWMHVDEHGTLGQLLRPIE
ncbi:MAG TPA: histidinol dehydrogenase, partial [Nitrolancea sp.]|nr:histidinol dehydrogenase [Nitrolancea sp.]